jgi:ABC-type branched-subunit amino acid transport system substrate-binding protein
VKVDDESDPAKATDNVNKLIKRDNVDVLVGTVHSGVAMAMAKVAKDTGTLLIVPNAVAAEQVRERGEQVARRSRPRLPDVARAAAPSKGSPVGEGRMGFGGRSRRP